MAIYTTFFLCRPEELPGGFPGWQPPLATPVRRELRNPFTGQVVVVESREPQWPEDASWRSCSCAVAGAESPLIGRRSAPIPRPGIQRRIAAMGCMLSRVSMVAVLATLLACEQHRLGSRSNQDSALTPNWDSSSALTWDSESAPDLGQADAAADVPTSIDVSVPQPDLAAADTSIDRGTTSLCGNDVLDPGEDCEDGNLGAGDGCDPSCHYESDPYRNCGNGRIDPGEVCDDGNRRSGDGCDDKCCSEGCFACTLGCIAPRKCGCGNRMLESGEECDDGNTLPGDGCNQFCRKESPTCGNGVLDPGEQCDDGNRVNGDGCDAGCRFDPPDLICKLGASVCADGEVTGKETCDDGNVFGGDGCSPKCSVEPGYFCPTPGKPCLPIPDPSGCGDGLLAPWEACDDGINDGRYDGCNPDCTKGPRCGDGIVQTEHELCDEGSGNGGFYGGCRLDCKPASYCGDGRVDLGYEKCDDGINDVTYGPGCTPQCTLPARCGDGVVQPQFGEECDDGADANGLGDRCSSDCRLTMVRM
jgi:cysteine-rich repeat protein